MSNNIIKWLTIFNTMGVLLIGGFLGYLYFGSRPSAPPQPKVVKNIDMKPLIEGATYMGSEDPKVNIVVFNSFTCGYCRKSKDVLEKIVKSHPDKVRLVFRHFERNEVDVKAGNAAECAREQNKFWEMYDQIFGDETGRFDFQGYAKNIGLNMNQFNQCTASNKYATRINQDSEMGRNLGINGTPSFVINGELMVGYRPYDMFDSKVKSLF